MTDELSKQVDELLPRLNGIYTVSVKDGAGLFDGKDSFTRQFDTMPICIEAAKLIQALSTKVREQEKALESTLIHAKALKCVIHGSHLMSGYLPIKYIIEDVKAALTKPIPPKNDN